MTLTVTGEKKSRYTQLQGQYSEKGDALYILYSSTAISNFSRSTISLPLFTATLTVDKQTLGKRGTGKRGRPFPERMTKPRSANLKLIMLTISKRKARNDPAKRPARNGFSLTAYCMPFCRFPPHSSFIIA